MPVVQSPLLEAAEEMLNLMLSRATGGVPEEAEYRRCRERLLSDPSIAPLVPRFVRTCRDPDTFWNFIKSRFSGSGSYDARRTFLHEQFEPLLARLERFDSSPVDELASEAVKTLSSASVTAAWGKAAQRRGHDPDGAITAARSLLESVCKTILDDAGVEYDNRDDLPKLYRKVCDELGLTPSTYEEQEFRRILGGCVSVVEGLGSVRNRQGDSHGQGRKSYRPAPRHATLAVNLAGSMAVFLVETWEERRAEEPW